jgi:hypothetical protein
MNKTLIITCGIIILLALAIWTPKTGAYPTYSISRDATNCRACHGDFRSSPYISLSDGQNWGNDLMDIHKAMLNNDCDTCHKGTKFPVFTDDSDGGTGLASISCVGCHGRDEDFGNDSLSDGLGAGLRQHHFNAGTTLCAGCHSDANPANYTPVGEDVPPSYYFTPDVAHPNKPTNPCNPSGEEDFAGIVEGLDNDGDDLYDANDPDCDTCGNGVLDTGEDCDPSIPGTECCESDCTYSLVGSDCSDGEYCNGNETCNDMGICLAGTPVDCGDGVGCTDDSCDEGNDICLNIPNNINCNDGLYCNGIEICDETLDCQPGTPVDCGDGVGCTDDSCDEGNDICENTPNDANCPDDGLYCNGTEFCDPLNDCSSTGTPCPGGTICNETTDTCDPIGCTNDFDCDDGQYCNGIETCNTDTGICQQGIAIDCSDGIGCTDDSCDEVNDVCVNDPNDTSCDDGVGCTVDTCDPVSDCQFMPEDATCDDGAFCTGVEICDAVFDCQAGPGDPCVLLVCDEDLDECVDGDDTDGDSVPDSSDNCPNHPNGPSQGTCTAVIGVNRIVSTGQSCTVDADCDPGEFCEKVQADNYPPGGNGIGDACDCEANFNCDTNVDATDVAAFLADFGRSVFFNPCTNTLPCNGDFLCDVDVDADDVVKFLEDFGRSQFFDPCPSCVAGPWCVYP